MNVVGVEEEKFDEWEICLAATAVCEFSMRIWIVEGNDARTMRQRGGFQNQSRCFPPKKPEEGPLAQFI